jgi:hypothetical protein
MIKNLKNMAIIYINKLSYIDIVLLEAIELQPIWHVIIFPIFSLKSNVFDLS